IYLDGWRAAPVTGIELISGKTDFDIFQHRAARSGLEIDGFPVAGHAIARAIGVRVCAGAVIAVGSEDNRFVRRSHRIDLAAIGNERNTAVELEHLPRHNCELDAA